MLENRIEVCNVLKEKIALARAMGASMPAPVWRDDVPWFTQCIDDELEGG